MVRLFRTGLKLESFKFVLYVSIPIFATLVYGAPDNMRAIVNRHKFIVYPPEGERAGEIERLSRG